MLNIDKVEKVYLACGYTDLRKSSDGLIMIVIIADLDKEAL
ncbi:IS66 Orf2 like protein [Clostridium saccharobutylicum]|uniref:IS66 Orf2 like protein n=1 Tax=Clostridium saccharobutylicum DSM 13864 TaxID=1345695 RepID=U5MQH7_CLOSA|nr:IS66 Orf2 like protein [Clostridium saccharobutylicum]AGX43044.1 IS66 Orf2 like protein [Clostridium saccharobutylicum DSM 13864]AQR90334.1 hypothetical protein CLOSC_20490 [Clostridium saccharobutylicum]AQS00240.1 hypothetical protein CSACC_20560 [Clostridium saccharobutylicum]AQS10040.1 hypothetical protein CLOBY_21790 [Clostridium saccharobutylicum]AQS14223.1 hypothetical protein CLOSACC_20560 [Clostridium saccharobutylicum]